MKTWMLPWLFPVGPARDGVCFAVVTSRVRGLDWPGWLSASLIVPVLWRSHFPSASDDADTRYWRTKAQ